MPTAVIIDDSALIRSQLRQILTRLRVTVVAEASTGDQARPLYEQHRPDLITLDVAMPGKDGVTAAVELLRDFPTACIVMCTSLAAREKILACQRAGVRHYLLKPYAPARAEHLFRFVVRNPGRSSGARCDLSGAPVR